MQKTIYMSRLGGTALAAVLALYATPALAQEATPQITVPTEQAAPAVTADPVATTPAPAPTPDPLAAEPAAPAETTATTEAAPATTTSKKSTAKPAATKPAARATTSPRASAAPAAAAPVAAPADATLPTEAPVIDPPIPVAPIAAAPAPAPEATPVDTVTGGDTLPIALGAGLGLLALGGAAFALRRRRRDDVEDEVIYTEPTIARTPEPAAQPEPVLAERSAFAWGAPGTAAAATSASSSSKNWVDRAHAGPTPENPFLSLKKRLQRAAFYDQRERAVAAGRAKPLSPMAGLPQRFAEAIKPRTSAPASSYGFSYVPA